MKVFLKIRLFQVLRDHAVHDTGQPGGSVVFFSDVIGTVLCSYAMKNKQKGFPERL